MKQTYFNLKNSNWRKGYFSVTIVLHELQRYKFVLLLTFFFDRLKVLNFDLFLEVFGPGKPAKSQIVWLQSCFIYIFLRLVLTSDRVVVGLVVGIRTFPFLPADSVYYSVDYDQVKTRLSEAEAEEPTNHKSGI